MYPLLLVLALATPPTDLVALGIVVSPHPERSVALLRSGGRTRIVGVGETAFGGRVAAIGPDTVSLDFDPGRVQVRLAGRASAAAAPVAPAASRGAAEASGLALDRREVERRLGEEAPRILAETTLTPAFDGGRVAGFTITRMPESSLLTEAGLRAGDVLVAVNDVPIDSMATLISLWPRLQTERTVRAVVLRNGQPVSLAVTFR